MRLADIYWPPVGDGDYLTAARARLLAGFCLLVAGFGFVSGVLSGLKTFSFAPLLSVFGALAPLSFLLLPAFAYATGGRIVAAIAFLALVYVEIVLISVGDNGALSTTAFYLAGLPPLAVLLGGYRSGIAACFIVIATYVFLSPAYVYGWHAFTLCVLAIGLTAAVSIFHREMQNATQGLIAARVSAEAGDKAKTEFIANVSHEIRTPLNGVMGMAQLLAETELTPLQRQYANTILTSGNSLLALINDILDMARIEAAEARLDASVFDLSDLVNEAAETVKGVAVQKGLSITGDVAPDAIGYYRGDQKKLRQILINFAGNAVKFTESGFVAIEASRIDERRLRFTVTDTGPGVPSDQQARIFERFKQADGSAARRHGGAGLGLAISKELAQLMNGEVGVCNAPGGGSVFWFEAAIAKASPFELGGEDAAPFRATPPLSKPMRILVVEDNPVNKAIVCAALKGRNVDVQAADNGAEALDLLDGGERYDVILMDVQMPVMPGDEALRRIRASGKAYAQTPIVMLTATAEQEAVDAIKAAGADAYLTKPLNIPQLYEALQRRVGPARDVSLEVSVEALGERRSVV